MELNFEFATAGRIYFGEGKVALAPKVVAEYGSKALVVCGKSHRPYQSALIENLRLNGIGVEIIRVSGEPAIEEAEAGAELAIRTGCQVVVGFGGGSSLDCAKAVAALATNPGPALNYLEVIGKGLPLRNTPLPIIAIPTTAGTGTEVTRNAVLMSRQTNLKASLRHLLMIPRVAIVDPTLTYSMPADVTAATGMDALSQLIEPYLSTGRNSFTDLFCEEGIKRVGRALLVAWQNGEDATARNDMSYASMLSGLALANAKLGAVHGFAGPVGGMFNAPHGMLCARFLAPVMRANLRATQADARLSSLLPRFRFIAQALGGSANILPEDGIRWVETACQWMGVPTLGYYGVTSADVPRIVVAAKNASSMKGNPALLTDGDLERIVLEAINPDVGERA